MNDVPRHIAIIMDGNGRWAQERGLPRVAGHISGVDSVREIVKTAAEAGVEVLTLYAFSHENWKRPKQEVSVLMELLERFLKKELQDLMKNGIRLQAIGHIEALPQPALGELQRAIEGTRSNRGLILNLALNYGARQEILDAVKKMTDERRPITEEEFSRCLYTAGLPDPDLLIRTSGEMRISNFLLWQISYAEIYITKKYWPDFRREDLLQAIEDYRRRERRFGDVQREPNHV